MQDTQCIYNGHLVSIYEPAIPFANRAFRYGDALFESIRLCNGKIMFIRDHIVRLKLGMTVLRMNVPAEFKTENIISLIEQLCEKNKELNDENENCMVSVFSDSRSRIYFAFTSIIFPSIF